MADAIAVLNAGSSSIKFSVYLHDAGRLEVALRGQVEGLHRAPRFVARDRSGQVDAEKSWGEGVSLGHFPQSLHSSTVGGWVATRASGTFSTLHGNIDDRVVGMKSHTMFGQFACQRLRQRGARF